MVSPKNQALGPGSGPSRAEREAQPQTQTRCGRPEDSQQTQLAQPAAAAPTAARPSHSLGGNSTREPNSRGSPPTRSGSPFQQSTRSGVHSRRSQIRATSGVSRAAARGSERYPRRLWPGLCGACVRVPWCQPELPARLANLAVSPTALIAAREQDVSRGS
jgi:hypothetical protein